MRRIGLLIVSAGLLAGCSSSEVIVAHSVALVPETVTVPEDELVDVSVSVFDSGIPEGEIAGPCDPLLDCDPPQAAERQSVRS